MVTCTVVPEAGRLSIEMVPFILDSIFLTIT